MSPAEFRADTERAKKRLEDLTGRAVLGYRAACWSVSRPILPWFYETLESLGVSLLLFGVPGEELPLRDPRLPGLSPRAQAQGAPHPNPRDPRVGAAPDGTPIGYSGGFYLRLFPPGRSSGPCRAEPARDPGVRLPPPAGGGIRPSSACASAPKERFIHYHNLRSTERKLKALLARFSFSTMGEYSEGFRDGRCFGLRPTRTPTASRPSGCFPICRPLPDSRPLLGPGPGHPELLAVRHPHPLPRARAGRLPHLPGALPGARPGAAGAFRLVKVDRPELAEELGRQFAVELRYNKRVLDLPAGSRRSGRRSSRPRCATRSARESADIRGSASGGRSCSIPSTRSWRRPRPSWAPRSTPSGLRIRDGRDV